MQEITFDELSTLKQPSASLRTALDRISAALGSVGDAGQQARSVVDELRVSLRAAAAQSVKSARSLAKFDEINRLSAPAEDKTAAPEKQKKAVRTIMKELFNVLPTAEDEDTMMSEFRRYCERTITSIDRLEPRYQLYAYPGKQVLAEGKKLMSSLLQINAPLEFFKEVSDGQDELLDFGEDFEPVQKFFSPNSEQEQIFRRALDMLGIYDDSKTYIVNTALEDVVRQMRSIVGMKAPYREIPKLPELREKFMTLYNEILEEQSAPVVKAIKDLKDKGLSPEKLWEELVK